MLTVYKSSLYFKEIKSSFVLQILSHSSLIFEFYGILLSKVVNMYTLICKHLMASGHVFYFYWIYLDLILAMSDSKCLACCLHYHLLINTAVGNWSIHVKFQVVFNIVVCALIYGECGPVSWLHFPEYSWLVLHDYLDLPYDVFMIFLLCKNKVYLCIYSQCFNLTLYYVESCAQWYWPWSVCLCGSWQTPPHMAAPITDHLRIYFGVMVTSCCYTVNIFECSLPLKCSYTWLPC